MKKIIIEVGSTNTKVDSYDGKEVKRLKEINIEFKKNYKKENKLNDNDVNKLINEVNDLKSLSCDIYVCGTSIFRNLSDDLKNNFIESFKKQTDIDFDIISQDEENKLTVYGATNKVHQRVAVMIGGGGSTEISIYDGGIKEMVNSDIGVMDVNEHFPDLADDVPTTGLDEVIKFIKERLNAPQEKADVLILAGGAHKYFILESGFNHEENNLYHDENAPIMMDIETRKNDTIRYYEKMSLDEIRSRVKDPKWWYGTRAMCAFVLVVAEAVGAKYVVPTDISMVYGIIGKNSD